MNPERDHSRGEENSPKYIKKEKELETKAVNHLGKKVEKQTNGFRDKIGE